MGGMTLATLALAVLACTTQLLVVLASPPSNTPKGHYVCTEFSDLDNGFEARYKFKQAADQFSSPFHPFPEMTMRVKHLSNSIMRVTITDADDKKKRWEVPGFPVCCADPDREPTVNRKLLVDEAMEGEPFHLRVRRNELLTGGPASVTGEHEPMWLSDDVILTDRYLSISNSNVGKYIYGFGEHVAPYLHDLEGTVSKTYTLFAGNADGGDGAPQSGSHPFYMDVQSNGRAHGVLLMNSNAMDVTLQAGKVKYEVGGGILDFYFFVGPDPSDVSNQLTQIIGRPHIPPLWSLGYHHGRWGYQNVTSFETMVNKFQDNQLPIDAFWIDGDYMQDFKTWSLHDSDVVSKTNSRADYVSELPRLVAGLHLQQKKVVLLVDPGVNIHTVHAKSGVAADLFVKNADGKKPFIGKTYAGLSYYPDWYHPLTPKWWYDGAKSLHDLVPFDGIFIDMNEPSSFCDGRCDLTVAATVPGADVVSPSLETRRCQCSRQFTGISDELNQPVWKPEFTERRHSRAAVEIATDEAKPAPHRGLDVGTIDMGCRDTLTSTDGNTGRHYDTHNLYGMQMTAVSDSVLQRLRQRKRSFVMSRSTFMGSGATAGHWINDNHSTWASLRQSIRGVLTMGLMGVSMVGSPICGMHGDVTPELCTRWMQVGQFMPFMRNHNSPDAAAQEPYALGMTHKYASMTALYHRYKLVPYLYSMYYAAHFEGQPIVRALSYEFPAEIEATHGIDTQFMVGSALLVCAVTSPGAAYITPYFPVADWYDFDSGKLVMSSDIEKRTMNVETPISSIPHYIRGGEIMVVRTRKLSDTALSVVQQITSSYTVMVALPNNAIDLTDTSDGPIRPRELATGDVFIDDGESTLDGVYTHIEYTVKSHTEEYGFTLSSEAERSGYDVANEYKVGRVIVMGAQCESTCMHVKVNGQTVKPLVPSDDGISHVIGRVEIDLEQFKNVDVSISSDIDMVFTCLPGCPPKEELVRQELSHKTAFAVWGGVASFMIIVSVACLFFVNKERDALSASFQNIEKQQMLDGPAAAGEILNGGGGASLGVQQHMEQL